jgi:hypothetical protein
MLSEAPWLCLFFTSRFDPSCNFSCWRFRSPASKDLEIVVLRRQVRLPAFRAADRVFLSAASRLCPASTGRPLPSLR